MSKILVNTTSSAVNIGDTGQQVPASGQLTIAPVDDSLYRNSSDVVTLVGNGTLTVSDGTNDLDISDGIDLIKGFFGSGEVKILDDEGNAVQTLVGPAGATGDQGPPGQDGATGAQGPAGPMELVGKDVFTGVITLSDSEAFVNWRNINFNIPQDGDYVIMGTIAVRAHSTGNDMIFEWDLDGSLIGKANLQREEFKDTNSNGSMNRPIFIDLPGLSAGNKSLQYYFRKEADGGTAQIKYICLYIFRVA